MPSLEEFEATGQRRLDGQVAEPEPVAKKAGLLGRLRRGKERREERAPVAPGAPPPQAAPRQEVEEFAPVEDFAPVDEFETFEDAPDFGAAPAMPPPPAIPPPPSYTPHADAMAIDTFQEVPSRGRAEARVVTAAAGEGELTLRVQGLGEEVVRKDAVVRKRVAFERQTALPLQEERDLMPVSTEEIVGNEEPDLHRRLIRVQKKRDALSGGELALLVLTRDSLRPTSVLQAVPKLPQLDGELGKAAAGAGHRPRGLRPSPWMRTTPGRRRWRRTWNEQRRHSRIALGGGSGNARRPY